MGDVVTIACDESGSEGENVTESAHRVFCHGSTDLSAGEAADVIAYARKSLKTQAPELKSEQLLTPRARPLAEELFAAGGPLDGRCQMNLTDKEYFLVGKVIDLLIVELAYDTGVDLYIGRQSRQLAYDLFREGARALGPEPWEALLRKFNSLMRTTQRSGLKVSVDEFYDALDELKYRARRRKVEDVLVLLARTRPQAEEFQALLADPRTVAALDPLLAALPETIRIWHESPARPSPSSMTSKSHWTRPPSATRSASSGALPSASNTSSAQSMFAGSRCRTPSMTPESR